MLTKGIIHKMKEYCLIYINIFPIKNVWANIVEFSQFAIAYF